MKTSDRKEAASVLVVDSDRDEGRALRRILLRRGYRAELSRDGLDAIARGILRRYDLVLADVSLPGVDGIEVARSFQNAEGRPLVILMSDVPCRKVLARSDGLRLAGVLSKPLRPGRVEAQVRSLLGRRPRETSETPVRGRLDGRCDLF
jgi:DNA-binding response OmpR family regulator